MYTLSVARIARTSLSTSLRRTFVGSPTFFVVPPVPEKLCNELWAIKQKEVDSLMHPKMTSSIKNWFSKRLVVSRMDSSFDEKEFLEGAKVAMQYFADNLEQGTIDNLRDVTTPDLFTNLKNMEKDFPPAGSKNWTLLDVNKATLQSIQFAIPQDQKTDNKAPEDGPMTIHTYSSVMFCCRERFRANLLSPSIREALGPYLQAVQTEIAKVKYNRDVPLKEIQQDPALSVDYDAPLDEFFYSVVLRGLSLKRTVVKYSPERTERGPYLVAALEA